VGKASSFERLRNLNLLHLRVKRQDLRHCE
jgi:hypothetical protein